MDGHQKPFVRLVLDTLGWSFHHIAQQLVRRLSDEFDFEIVEYSQAGRDPRPCQAVVCFWWRVLPQLQLEPGQRVITCLYDHWSPYEDRAGFQAAMDQSHFLVLANERLVPDLQGVRLPPFWICPDGVDLELFPWSPLPDLRCFGWGGRADVSKTREGEEDNKGLALLKRAATVAKEPLLVFNSAQQQVKHDKMAEAFYRRISVYCCASESEGTPNAVLEALACGRPVLTTDVGIVPHVVHHGVNGLIVPRDVESFAAAMKEMAQLDLDKMSRAARRSVRPFAWDQQIGLWRDCLLAACDA